VLDRLERERLVTKRVAPQQDRPDRVVYRLTKAGRAEIDEWLETPFVRRAYRDDLFLKLLAASVLGRGELETVVRVQREAYMAELGALTKLRRTHRGEKLVSLLIEAAIRHTKADLGVVELAEASIDELAPELSSADQSDTGAAAAGSAG